MALNITLLLLLLDLKIPRQKALVEVAELQSNRGFVLDDRTVSELMNWQMIEIDDWTWL